MTAAQEETTVPAATRVEQTLIRAGKQLGHLAGQATIRFQHATQAFREEADQLDMPTEARPKSLPPADQETQTRQFTTERAEELVDHLGQRVACWAIGGNLSLQRALARLREDAEDMWVEAQALHKEWLEKRGIGENRVH